MKIGDVVKTEEIANQEKYRWVVLSPLTLDENECVTGGHVCLLSQNADEAEQKVLSVHRTGERVLLVEGLIPELITVGDVFVY